MTLLRVIDDIALQANLIITDYFCYAEKTQKCYQQGENVEHFDVGELALRP